MAALKRANELPIKITQKADSNHKYLKANLHTVFVSSDSGLDLHLCATLLCFIKRVRRAFLMAVFSAASTY